MWACQLSFSFLCWWSNHRNEMLGHNKRCKKKKKQSLKSCQRGGGWSTLPSTEEPLCSCSLERNCLISYSLPSPPCFLILLFAVHPNVSQGCQGGCATCSDYNGCLSCKPRLFFVLERIGMKQIGVCLSSCPSGYYGTRYPDINKCASKCWGKGKHIDLFVLFWMLLRSQVNREAGGQAEFYFFSSVIVVQ